MIEQLLFALFCTSCVAIPFYLFERLVMPVRIETTRQMARYKFLSRLLEYKKK